MRSLFCPIIFQLRSKNKAWLAIVVAVTGCLLASITAAGCSKVADPLEENWAYADLLALDPIDTQSPEAEILALYWRINGADKQIRLDLLDVNAEQPTDLYLFFDSAPDGIDKTPLTPIVFQDLSWESRLHSSSEGIDWMDSSGNVLESGGIRIDRDTFMDAVYISLPRDFVAGPEIKLAVISLPGGEELENAKEYDVVGPVSTGAPPPAPVQLILAFSEVFQAATPSQALRSWDGAHSGPDSARHGLRYLFEAIGKYKLPTLVAGLGDQRVTSAMEYLGVAKWYWSLKDEGILFESECFNGDYGYAHYIVNNLDSAAEEGLVREKLAEIVETSQASQGRPVWLAGSFRNSTWGTPEASGASMAYLAGHTWIKLLDATDMKQLSCTTTEGNSDDSQEQISYKLLEEYGGVGNNALSELAWDTYENLSQPGSEAFRQLADQYIGQVGHILAAAEWANAPRSMADCDRDLDQDGEAECVLANESFFTTYELDGGSLAFAFYVNEDGAHQIIGPSYQLAVGLSDPTRWDLQNGMLADPAQIIGAAANPTPPLGAYTYRVGADRLELSSPDMATRIVVELDGRRMRVDVFASDPAGKYQLPLIIDPWLRFQPDWASLYAIENQDKQWTVTTKDDLTVQINATVDFTADSFLGPYPLMAYPEDPNADYTRGYFLPFPLTLLETAMGEELSFEIQVMP
jgi:hypothetical protein